MPGTKTSIYLSEAQTERWKASGASLASLVDRGLDADEPEPSQPATLAQLREELGALEERIGKSVCTEIERAAGQSYA